MTEFCDRTNFTKKYSFSIFEKTRLNYVYLCDRSSVTDK